MDSRRPANFRAINSVGRVSVLHTGCRRFESCIAHHFFPDSVDANNIKLKIFFPKLNKKQGQTDRSAKRSGEA